MGVALGEMELGIGQHLEEEISYPLADWYTVRWLKKSSTAVLHFPAGNLAIFGRKDLDTSSERSRPVGVADPRGGKGQVRRGGLASATYATRPASKPGTQTPEVCGQSGL